jgi:ankyrin repeat protein
MAAIQGKYIEIVKLLIAAGADIHLKDKSGLTALVSAISLGDIRIINELGKAKTGNKFLLNSTDDQYTYKSGTDRSVFVKKNIRSSIYS